MQVNLKEIEEERKRNFEERLRFIDMHVKYLKETPNEEWSKHQKELVDNKKVFTTQKTHSS